MDSKQATRPFKPRRPHKKSRNGCQYCRRRRIKCDETRPQCDRCASRNQPCEYLTQTTSPKDKSPSPHTALSSNNADISNDSTTSDPRDGGYGTSPSHISSFEHTPVHSGVSPPLADLFFLDQESCPLPRPGHNGAFDDTKIYARDLYLLEYYLGHLSKMYAVLPDTLYAMTIGVPSMAARHKGLLSSLLALGAACLCIDILTNKVPTGISSDNIVELIRIGDRYHQQGIEFVHNDIMSINCNDPRLSQMQAVMVFPYTLSRRRILRLLHGQSGPSIFNCSNLPVDLAPDSPINLEWVVCLRGVTTTGLLCKFEKDLATRPVDGYLADYQTLDSTTSTQVLEKVSQYRQQNSSDLLSVRDLGSRHPLFSVLSSTTELALENLQRKIDNLQRRVRQLQRKTMIDGFQIASLQQAYSATLAAFTLAVDFLVGTADNIFDEYEELPEYTMPEDLDTSWQEYFCSPREYHPDLPMTPLIMSWINRVPSEYMNMLSKPLPSVGYDIQDVPGTLAFPDIDMEMQLLAWDIYAHWLVFVILIEHERWYVADLGVFDIEKVREMVKRYAASGNSESPTSSKDEREYWPSAMSSLAQRLQAHPTRGPTV